MRLEHSGTVKITEEREWEENILEHREAFSKGVKTKHVCPVSGEWLGEDSKSMQI